MNEIELAESFFPALQDRPIIHNTIGAVLKDTALKRGRNEALVEVKQDATSGAAGITKHYIKIVCS